MRLFILVAISLGIAWHVQPTKAQVIDHEVELIQYLKNNLTNFSPLARPNLDINKTVYIFMDTSLTQLVSVDSAKQSVKIGAFMQAYWFDERLVWDPSKFGKLTTVMWDASALWYPVILIYNGLGDSQLLTAQLPIFLSSISPKITKVTSGWRREFEFSCNLVMTKFPLDQHVCELEFFFNDQSRGNPGVMPVQATIMPFEQTGLYRENSEWKLLNMSTEAVLKPYKLVQGVDSIHLPTYVIRLKLERVPDYYIMNIITPLLLLTLLQVLLYFVPLESGEKLGFGITIMLSYTVFLLLLDGILPKSQTMPDLASFITSAMVLSTISLLLTSLIMRLHFAPEGTRMPICVRTVLVRFLARVFCVTGASQDRQTEPLPENGAGTGSQTSVRKLAEGAAEASPAPPIRSEWVVAAHAIERLMVALGVAATAIITGIFVVKPLCFT